MISVYQTKFGVPGGNCMQACLASMLGRPLDEIPDFCNMAPEDNWLHRLLMWLRPQGVYPVLVNLSEPNSAPIEGPCVLGVKTEASTHKTWLHAVVGHSKIEEDGVLRFFVDHDPNPFSSKIIKIIDALFLVKPI